MEAAKEERAHVRAPFGRHRPGRHPAHAGVSARCGPCALRAAEPGARSGSQRPHPHARRRLGRGRRLSAARAWAPSGAAGCIRVSEEARLPAVQSRLPLPRDVGLRMVDRAGLRDRAHRRAGHGREQRRPMGLLRSGRAARSVRQHRVGRCPGLVQRPRRHAGPELLRPGAVARGRQPSARARVSSSSAPDSGA